MRSWNLAILCVVVAYFAVSSAISSAVRHFISIPPEFAGEQRYAPGKNAGLPPCMRKSGNVAWSATPPTNGLSDGFGENSWDFSGPDDVPNHAPMPPCEGRGSE